MRSGAAIGRMQCCKSALHLLKFVEQPFHVPFQYPALLQQRVSGLCRCGEPGDQGIDLMPQQVYNLVLFDEVLLEAFCQVYKFRAYRPADR